MGAGVDAAGTPVDASAQVTGRGSLLNHRNSHSVSFFKDVVQFSFGVNFLFGEAVHVDVAVRTILGAQPATDAVVFDLDLERVAITVNGVDRASDQAIGVHARATTACHEKLVES